MIRDYIAHMHLGPVQTISLVFFLTIYFVAILWTYRKGANEIHKKLATDILDKNPNSEEKI